ncbi:MAG: methylated-DNA--[protein]-cysteine S-methyltransferase [Burkholderiales bacterium]
MNTYERIARVIRYLDAHQAEQPDLATLAAQSGLSPAHFHRLFSAWAGVTPKDFLQCLTVTHAKALLNEGGSVLDAALQAGLSGPGRLHDLCVGLEAASPGELKSGGAGWRLRFGFAESPFGTCSIAQGPRGICHLSFVEEATEPSARASLAAQWPNALLERDDALAAAVARHLFARPAQCAAPLRAFVKGTAFQVRVWRALLQVPPGHVVTYGQLATLLGQPSAARAVGTAVGRNPLAFLIPCHRVIRETGVIGGYRWGTLRKRMMLACESAQRSSAAAASSNDERLIA